MFSQSTLTKQQKSEKIMKRLREIDEEGRRLLEEEGIYAGLDLLGCSRREDPVEEAAMAAAIAAYKGAKSGAVAAAAPVTVPILSADAFDASAPEVMAMPYA